MSIRAVPKTTAAYSHSHTLIPIHSSPCSFLIPILCSISHTFPYTHPNSLIPIHSFPYTDAPVAVFLGPGNETNRRVRNRSQLLLCWVWNMATLSTAPYHGYQVLFSPFSPHKLAFTGAVNYGIAGNLPHSSTRARLDSLATELVPSTTTTAYMQMQTKGCMFQHK